MSEFKNYLNSRGVQLGVDMTVQVRGAGVQGCRGLPVLAVGW